ncbi:hypothetical protein J4210_04850 [Candidatus Woesearchaeota archaeon]|nr:hypothetical protein [Candidatus Woesearchaeota archaeon]
MQTNEAKKQEQISRLERYLATAFEQVRGASYSFLDEEGNVYDELLRNFSAEQQERLLQQISRTMAKPGVHRIMDQGCGEGNTIWKITSNFAQAHPDNQFEGYGVTAALEYMKSGNSTKDPAEWSQEEDEFAHQYDMYPFASTVKNASLYGLEQDLHTAMRDFPRQLDLAISDHTYFHLAAPWLVFKRTADRLRTGGTAIIRNLFYEPVYIRPEEVLGLRPTEIVRRLEEINQGYEFLLEETDRISATLAIIRKRQDVPFRTNISLRSVRWDLSHYFRETPNDNFLSIDEL